VRDIPVALFDDPEEVALVGDLRRFCIICSTSASTRPQKRSSASGCKRLSTFQSGSAIVRSTGLPYSASKLSINLSEVSGIFGAVQSDDANCPMRDGHSESSPGAALKKRY